jgi:hypothetical protein
MWIGTSIRLLPRAAFRLSLCALRCLVLCSAVLAAPLLAGWSGAEGADDQLDFLCRDGEETRLGAQDAESKYWSAATTRAEFPTAFLPNKALSRVVVDRKFDASNPLEFRVFARPVSAAARAPRQLATFAQEGGGTFSDSESAMDLTVVTFRAPDVREGLWPTYEFLVIGCDGATAEVVARLESNVSRRVIAILGTAITVAVLYLIISVSIANYRNIPNRLNPVKWAAGAKGKASLSILQVIWFSTIVFALTTYFVLRLGGLSELSVDVLYLMGISLAGAAGATAVAVNRKRLDNDLWAWLVNRKWVKAAEPGKPSEARLGEIFMEGDRFDPAKYQAAIFSVVVGGYLFVVGFDQLATFTIPDTYLGLLGGSQVIYLLGKGVAPPSYDDLKTMLKDALAKEEALRKKAKTQNITVLDDAAKQQLGQVYDDAREAMDKAAPMVESLYGVAIEDDKREPKL